MKQPIQKAYYGGIFFEFAVQERLADAVIILPEFPGKMEHHELIEAFASKGYHVFFPKYRGSFQSSGSFLSRNPIDDFIMFVVNVQKGEVKSLWDMKKKMFKINKLILVASSFSGAVACGLAVKSNAFSHLILASPIWDFRCHNQDGNESDYAHLTVFVKRAYQNMYRFQWKNVQQRMLKWSELTPEYYLPALQKLPSLVLHDPNDNVVAFKHTREMLQCLPRATLVEHYLGHVMNADLVRTYWKEVDKFVKVNYLG